MVQNEAVTSHNRDEALGFLVCGSSDGLSSRYGARTMRSWFYHLKLESVQFWWARQRARPVAAAMVVENPGRIGMLIFSSPVLPGVQDAPLGRLIQTISADALDSGMSLVQCLLEPYQDRDATVLRSAGYFRLAELIYMRLDLRSNTFEQPGQIDLNWRSCGDFSEAELARVIEATYIDSRDCAAISGLRKPSDIIATHKSCGIFCPHSWWIAEREKVPVGCILVNDCANPGESEVIYIGVVPQHRGKGLGKELICRAADKARMRNQVSLVLAVDASNNHAIKAYRTLGFAETNRRMVYVVTQERN